MAAASARLGVGVARQRFWLLDGERVVFNHFTGDGDHICCEQSEDVAVAKLCATAFDSVRQRAIPHEEYRPA